MKSKLSKAFGTMYISQHYVCFIAKAFGRTTRLVILFKDVRQVFCEGAVVRVEVAKANKKLRRYAFDLADAAQEAFGILKSIQSSPDLAAIQRNSNLVTLKRQPTKLTFDHVDSLAAGTSPLSAEDWAVILRRAKQQRFTSGQVVQKHGETSDSICQLQRGRLKLVIGEQTVSTLRRGDLFAEQAFFSGGVNPASVIADSDDVIVSSLNSVHLQCAFVRHPALAGKFYHHLCLELSSRLRIREGAIAKDKGAKASLRMKK